MPHIVLLSESIGIGHERAAVALEEVFLALYPNVRVTRLNLLDTFRPLTAKVTRTLYLQTLAHRPSWWGKWYEWQREKEWSSISRSIVRGVLRKDFGAWLQHLAPDAVVCTHPLPTCLVAEMKRKRILQVPLCTVLTDFDTHGYWTHPEVDLYCVPVPEMAHTLRERVQGSDIRVTGIPISQSFIRELSDMPIDLSSRKKRQQVLIMGGGLGIGILPMVERMIESNMQCDIVVVCGYNEVLYQELQFRYGTHSNVHILGYSQAIQKLMLTSDLLVTKPGGLTLSEALAMRLPMVLYTPSQGQEWRNGELMSKLGVAYTAHTDEEGVHYVRTLLKSETIRQKIVNCMEMIRRPHAAYDVAEAVMELVEQQIASGRTGWRQGV